jgi:preprotein translocase subunit SecD
MSIRNRLLLILALVALSIFYLVPRDITVRERDLETGVMRDRTEKRVPLKLGLDLQGGMHLALELDQSKQVSADPKRDLQLALTVLRKRVDEFGVTEPVTQMVGDDRIVVELPGIDDPARAKGIVQRSAFLEFRITDETNALEKAIPAMDRTLRGLGIRGESPTARPSAVEQLLGGDTAKRAGADSAAARKGAAAGDSGARDSAAADTAAPVPAGAARRASTWFPRPPTRGSTAC